MQIKDKDLMSIQEARDLISKAKIAQKELSKLGQKEIDEVVKGMADLAYEESSRLARMAVVETKFGKYEDKIIKNQFASMRVFDYIKEMKTVGIILEDNENKILEIATPVGVIAALVPSTNPTSTAIFKALIAVKSGNAIVFSPHPRAFKCICETARLLNDKAVELGAPDGIISCMTIPTSEGTSELMSHKDVSLILATGGSAMVKAAYASGTPALGVGPGNVPAFIERSANIDLAVEKILISKTFDNGTICASEQSIVTENCIKDNVQKEFIKQGGYFLKGEEVAKVISVMAKPYGGVNPQIVGQSALTIANMAGISVPEDTKVLICEQNGVGKEFPFSMEKLSPILGFYSEDSWQDACDRCIELLKYGGLGHSLVIHSNDEKVIREFALKKPVSRMLVNTPSSHGAIGATTGLAPSLTLGCGTIGGSATSDNVNPMHLINIRRVAYETKPAVQSAVKTKKKETVVSNTLSVDIEKITKLVLESLKNLKEEK
ncbi:MAG: acetaldehyde dehydrogenase (acetylating) [Alkaliphilus sp.]